MFFLIDNLIEKIRRRIQNEGAMTLVEVVLAFFIIAIISTVLIRGTITAVNTLKINRSKTEALAIANEKMEILKSINYPDVPLTSGDTENENLISTFPELGLPEDSTFLLEYLINWSYGEEGGSKQVKVSVSGDGLNVPVEVVTQFYPPVGEEATGGNIYPPPEDLTVDSDEIISGNREVALSWTAPDTERTILRYNIYRDDIYIGSALTVGYPDTLPDSNIYTYYVTAYYEGMESQKSNSISTGTPYPYPAPQNLIITGYSFEGVDRTVNLAWEAPITDLTIEGYIIYRDNLEVGTTLADVLIFDNIIGETNYTFYITALYEEENESVPSNMQTTE